MDHPYPLSDDMQRFVAQCEAFFPSSVIDQGLNAQRQAYIAMTDSFAQPDAKGVRIENRLLEGVPVRYYHPPAAVSNMAVLFAHGGGWYLGGLDSHHNFCLRLARDSQVTLIAVDYRLAPEARYPAALDDLSQVYLSLTERFSTIAIMGDSAGGNLMAALALRCRASTLRPPSAQFLIYPALAPFNSLPSHQQLQNAPLLDQESMRFCWQQYEPATPPADQSELFPLTSEHFRNLPDTYLYGAEFDPLIDDARHFAQRIQGDGGHAVFHKLPGLLHSALHAIDQCQESNQLYHTIKMDLESWKQSRSVK